MCGIAGFIGGGDQKDLKKMTDLLFHRGPDDEGLFLQDGVGLGHRRLSIIDLTQNGHQPMFSSDKRVVVVFNGEIYNFKDLKKDLIKDSYLFTSESDTEVIVALYQMFGEKCFEKMNGMFAIAIYDFEKNKLILGRDRLGKKPLYWGYFQETLIFSSELKSVIAHPLCKKEIDLISLKLYLSLDYVPTPRSIFKDIYKLEPGSILVYEDKKIRKETFWDLDFVKSDVSFDDAVFELDKKINESVRQRMVSDVPLGVFLSGGLDSSVIAYYAQKNSHKKIHTFSIGFSEKSFDESLYADKVSRYLNTQHHHLTLSSKHSLDLIPRIAELLDEPMADASIIPTYLLSKFTKEKVTVALGGDGGDELFAGYPTITQADFVFRFYRLLPNFVRKIILKAVEKIPASDDNFGFSFNLKKFVTGFDDDRFLTHQNWLGSFSDREISLLLKNNNEGVVREWLPTVMKNIHSEYKNNRILGMYMRTYMMDEVMVKVDRASMFASLETRSPFLDYKLVDFLNHLPYRFKLHGFEGKYILKKMMEGKLPSDIIWRKKKGFGIPLSSWLKGDLKEWCLSVLSKENIYKQGLFNYDFVEKLLADHFSGRQDNRKKIWNLLVFALWSEKWLK